MKLREQDKIRIENIAKQTLQTPLEIWAYGSCVNGDAQLRNFNLNKKRDSNEYFTIMCI
ncbi:MAG: hypothetical protein U9R50_09885 [Campylobacterota bacterium]|nr:hypothetical protein [Campylobacterota bacterium]